MKRKYLLIPFCALLLSGCGSASTNRASSSSSIEPTTIEPTSVDPTTSSEPTMPTDEGIRVSFNTMGGPSYPDMYFKDSEELTLPIPEYYHHHFLGWYENIDYSGDPILTETYIPKADITLYAKWEEVLYVYLYYGASTDYKRYEVREGDQFNIDEAYVPAPCSFNETMCDFIEWTYEDSGMSATGIITVNEDVFLVASYDKSNVSGKQHLYDAGNGIYEDRGNLAKVMYSGYDVSYFEFDIACTKGASGGAGFINHAKIGTADYVHEGGCYYMSCVFVPASGELNVQYIMNAYKGATKVNLSSLPRSFQDRFNSLQNGQEIKFHFSCLTGANSFTAYVDNEAVYTMSDINGSASKYGTYDFTKNTGVGFRSTSRGTVFSNVKYSHLAKNITLDLLGDGDNVTYSYLGGNLPTVSTNTPNYCVDMFSFDEEGKDIFDYTKADRLEDGMTLYKAHTRLYTNPSLDKLGGNKYVARGNLASLIGVTDKTSYTLELNLNVIKKSSSGGAIGAILGANMYADNTFENDSKYIMIQIAGTGGLQVATNDMGTFAHIQGSGYEGSKSLSAMPTNFQNAFNAASEGDAIPVKLTIDVTPSSATIWVNDQYVGAIVDSTILSRFNGKGYGVRANNAQCNSDFTYFIK